MRMFIYTVIRPLAVGTCPEKRVIWRFCRARIAECTHANLDGVTHRTPRLHGTACHFQAINLHCMYIQSSLLVLLKEKAGPDYDAEFTASSGWFK